MSSNTLTGAELARAKNEKRAIHLASLHFKASRVECEIAATTLLPGGVKCIIYWPPNKQGHVGAHMGWFQAVFRNAEDAGHALNSWATLRIRGRSAVVNLAKPPVYTVCIRKLQSWRYLLMFPSGCLCTSGASCVYFYTPSDPDLRNYCCGGIGNRACFSS